MYKWWIIGSCVLIIGSALVFRLFIQPKLSNQSKPVQTQDITEERISGIESAVEELSKQVGELKTAAIESTSSGTVSTTPLNFDVRLQNNEQAISVLQSQIKSLKGGSTSTSTSSTKPPIYIPLGSGGSTTSTSYQTTPLLQENIDPGNYPGYTSMQLEVIMRVLNGNGQAFAQLFNNTDGTSVGSQISTSSSDYVLLLSDPFTLPTGSKNYRVQMKSLTGYENDIQSARIKVNF